MRVWDCCPSELVQKHILAEHLELHYLWSAVHLARAGVARGRWIHHPETKRFLNHPELIVARHDFIRYIGHGRGLNLKSSPNVIIDDRIIEYEDIRLHNVFDYDDWYEFCSYNRWPTSYNDEHWSPWKRDKMTFQEYFDVLGKNWHRGYHSGARPDDDPHSIPIRDVTFILYPHH